MFIELYNFIEDRLVKYINKKYQEDFQNIDEIAEKLPYFDTQDAILVTAYLEKGYETFKGFDYMIITDDKNIIKETFKIITKAKELFLSNDELDNLHDWLEEEYATLENISSYVYNRLERRNYLLTDIHALIKNAKAYIDEDKAIIKMLEDMQEYNDYRTIDEVINHFKNDIAKWESLIELNKT